jgi:hypothetical protein
VLWQASEAAVVLCCAALWQAGAPCSVWAGAAMCQHMRVCGVRVLSWHGVVWCSKAGVLLAQGCSVFRVSCGSRLKKRLEKRA